MPCSLGWATCSRFRRCSTGDGTVTLGRVRGVPGQGLLGPTVPDTTAATMLGTCGAILSRIHADEPHTVLRTRRPACSSTATSARTTCWSNQTARPSSRSPTGSSPGSATRSSTWRGASGSFAPTTPIAPRFCPHSSRPTTGPCRTPRPRRRHGAALPGHARLLPAVDAGRRRGRAVATAHRRNRELGRGLTPDQSPMVSAQMRCGIRRTRSSAKVAGVLTYVRHRHPSRHCHDAAGRYSCDKNVKVASLFPGRFSCP